MLKLKKSCLLAVAVAATIALTGCAEEEAKVASGFQDVANTHSIAAAKDGNWPSIDVEDTDLMDSMPDRENIMVVLDMSGSMSESSCSGEYETKAVAAKTVLRDWVGGVKQETNLGLIIFDGKGTNVHLALGRDNRSDFVTFAENSYPEGGTPLLSAVSMAASELEKQASLQQGYGRYKMMVITDGAHSLGQDPSGPLKAIFGNPANPIEINTVGFCITQSALNQPGLTNYHSAQNPEELRKGLNSVLAESMDFNPLEEFDDDA